MMGTTKSSNDVLLNSPTRSSRIEEMISDKNGQDIYFYILNLDILTHLGKTIIKKTNQSCQLTQMHMHVRPLEVKLGVQFVIFAFQFNSFSVAT